MIALLMFAATAGVVTTPAESSPVNPAPRSPVLVDFVPAEIRCEGMPVTPRFSFRPVPAATYARLEKPGRVTLDFRIDETGRPLSIGSPKPNGYFHVDMSDLAPALAAWRFAPGTARGGCTVSFALETAPVAAAPAALVHRAFALPHSTQPAESALRERLRADDGDCGRSGRPAVRLRAYPDFDRIPEAPGSSSYAMVGFDIDAAGKPRNVRIRSSDGNTALDRAAIKAVRNSRFAPGARTGCSYPYHRRQGQPMPAPVLPPSATFRPANASCPAIPAHIGRVSRSDFPMPFVRRSIEGAAIIGYDVAPWGATGNVKILAAEPAAAFGEQAKRIVERSSRSALEAGSGLTGCVARFVFRLAWDDDTTPD
ncbi:TonB family protein [Sphingomonas koreensis]|uniref:TonB family protein n=1 Tax=Sphingomonas koreensis TaxID=93064 RepID=UPI00082CE862|nr:TonB family protein [Sphingomonas koreensis]PJI87600.1 TonB family protein [Sphingomonas koreensis]RSU62973.1 TonB family protein [Sphingomonas koreensis]RSU71682.1 TonB family protein [Sphingomonas koreensis]